MMLRAVAASRPKESLKSFDLIYAAVGSSAGIFAGMYYSSSYSGRQCLMCILENPNMDGELFNVTQQMLKTHHKRANKLFETVSDKRRDNVGYLKT